MIRNTNRLIIETFQFKPFPLTKQKSSPHHSYLKKKLLIDNKIKYIIFVYLSYEYDKGVMWLSNNHWGEDQVSVLFHAEICVHSVKAHYIIISNKSDELFYMLYVRNTNYSKFLLMKLCPKTDPSRITLILKVKLTFCCTRSHWGAAGTALLWKSPYQQTAKVNYVRESESHKETADVIRASWWRDHATFIDRSAMNTDNKGQKSQKNQTWSPKMRICCLPEDAECRACHTNTNYPYGLFGVGTSLPHDQTTVVWQTERTLTRLCWPCGCCSEGLVGCSPHPRAAANNHNFMISNQYGKKISKFLFAVSCRIGKKKTKKPRCISTIVADAQVRKGSAIQDVWKEHQTHLSPPSKAHR